MFALECASLLTRRINLTYEPLGSNDRTKVADALQATKACYRCPETERKGIPAAVKRLCDQGKEQRSDPLLGIWAIAREDLAGKRTYERNLWLAQHARCILPREAIESLLGLDRSATLELIGSSSVLAELGRQQSTGLCDNHLHSGAADELGDLLDRLVPRAASETEPRDLKKAVGTLRLSSDLNMGPPVLGLAAACLLLDDPAAADGPWAQLLADKAWWQGAARAALNATNIDGSEFGELRRPVQELANERGLRPQLKALYAALGEVARGQTVPEARQETARRGLISLAVLYGMVAVPHSSSLGTFVPRFEAMRALRGLFGTDQGRLTSAINSMYVNSKVTAVELRKSIVPKEGGTSVSIPRIRDAIKGDIEGHAWNAIAARYKAERDLVARMPLTFTRREYEPVDLATAEEGFVSFRDPVGETMAVADAIVQATATEPEGRFVGAVDVVGDEKLVPNWVYALAYQRIAGAEGCELEFACHAGEYFADRLEGLRRIGEVALFRPAAVRRIGHCLALGTSEGAESDVDDDALVLLENSIWALLVLENRGAIGLGQAKGGRWNPPDGLLDDLKGTAQQIASYVFGFDAGIGEVRRWYLERFDSTKMARWLPALRTTSAHDATTWWRGAERHQLPRPVDLVDGMLAATVYEMPVEVELPVEVKDKKGKEQPVPDVQRIRYDSAVELPANLRTQAHEQLARVEDAALESIRRWLKAERMVIESCPSSNAALIDVPITEHPIRTFHEQELSCSVNTDDPALFGASLGEEYVHVGMLADGPTGDGADFLAELAQTSRTSGMIERALCDPGEAPIEIYHVLLRRLEPPAAPDN